MVGKEIVFTLPWLISSGFQGVLSRAKIILESTCREDEKIAAQHLRCYQLLYNYLRRGYLNSLVVWKSISG